MKYKYLPKKDLGAFIEHLKGSYRVVAPVKKENLFVFEDVDDVEKVEMEYIPTVLPPKKYFFPQKQKLGSFSMGEVKMDETPVENEPTVIFGAHTCDIDGIECLDAVFHKEPEDPYYIKRRKSVFIIGYECMFPCDEYATCMTMDTHNPKAGYDVMITDAGDEYILHINSRKGEELTSGTDLVKEADPEEAKTLLEKLRKEKMDKFEKGRKLEAHYRDLFDVFEKSYDSEVWKDVGNRCVSCGNCTAVCPTCYCFDVQDEVELDMSGGDRNRTWDSCQLDEFATVAGDENFREERSSRQRHRYYRKFDYPIKKYNKFFCTGCGRCTRTCMAMISLIETVNDLTKENKDV